MDRSVKKDIQKRYAMMLKRFDGETNEISCFVCQQCGKVIKVRQTVKGMSPGGIDCPYCNGQATIEMFDAYPNITVTHEWYRPTLDEVLALAEENKAFTVNYILSGGLIRRECSKN